jgi:hypothetical protein
MARGRPRNAAPWEAPGWRRGLQLALAALWLLDAVLQYQTFMFSQGFPRMLAATAAGNPGPGRLPVAALFLAVAVWVSVSVVMSTDRLPALRPAPVPVTPAPAQAGPISGTTGQTATAGARPTAGSTDQVACVGTAPAPAGPRPVLCPGWLRAARS